VAPTRTKAENDTPDFNAAIAGILGAMAGIGIVAYFWRPAGKAQAKKQGLAEAKAKPRQNASWGDDDDMPVVIVQQEGRGRAPVVQQENRGRQKSGRGPSRV
jgi:hypothetical protein